MRNYIRHLAFLKSFYLLTGVQAQTFQKSYTGIDLGFISGIEKENDLNGYLYSTSNGTLSFIDLNGNLIWSKVVEGLDLTQNSMEQVGALGSSEPIVQTNNGEYILGGKTDYNFLGLSDEGTIAWKNYSPAGVVTNSTRFIRRSNSNSLIPGKIIDVSKSHGNGFVAGGNYIYLAAGGRPGYGPIILECDNNGEIVFMAEITAFASPANPPLNNYVSKVEPSKDGVNYLFQGIYGHVLGSPATSKLFIGKISPDGTNLLWDTYFYDLDNLDESDQINPTDFIELDDQRIISVGYDNATGYLLELNSLGILISSCTYTYNDLPIKILGIETDDSQNIWLMGEFVERDANGNFLNKTIMFQIDPIDFNQINQPIYYPNFSQTGNAGYGHAFKSFDSNFLIGGSSFDPANSSDMIIKTDIDGTGSNICYAEFNMIKKEPIKLNPLYEKDVTNAIFSVYADSISEGSSITVSTNDACCTIPLSLDDFNVICNPGYFLSAPDGNFLSYFWSTGQTTPTIPITEGNTYELTVVDENGCVGTASYTFELPLFDEFEIVGPDNKCCSKQVFQFNGPGGFADYQWSIDPSSSGTFAGQGTNAINVTWTNESESSIIYLSVITPNGCTISYEFTVKGCCNELGEPPVINTDFCQPTLISSLGLGSSFSSTGFIYLNHDLIIDVNFTFMDCPNILIESGRKIIVNPGILFIIEKSSLNAKCDDMWDGIYVNDPGSVIRIDGSTIEQALNAVVSDNGGVFKILNSDFINNYIGVKVNPYASPHGGVVNSTDFSSVTGALLIPHNQPTTRMYKAIEINEVEKITIGDANSNPNSFSNTDYGIYDSYSGLNSYNNHFSNMEIASAACTDCQCPVGTGICVIGNRFDPLDINVGGPGAAENKFMQVNHGIDVNFGMNLVADDNFFINNEVAIRYSGNINCNADITDNIIKKFNIGILCSNNLLTQLDIQNNDLNTSFTPFSILISNTGILVSNSSNIITRAMIQNNEISKVRNGIFLRNVRSSIGWPLTGIKVEDNMINFGVVNNTTIFTHYGIRLEQTTNAYINNNTIEKQNPINPNGSVVPFLRGISLLNSQGNTVTKNVVTKLGGGIRAFGNCANSTFECNTLTQNYYGFQFDGPSGIAAINIEQAPGGRPTGNTWTTLSGSVDITGRISPIASWYYPMGGYNPSHNLISGSLTNLNNPIAVPLTTTDRCNLFTALPPEEERENRIGKIARDEFSFPNFEDEFKNGNRLHAFTFLKENPAMLSLGTSDDTTYQNFYSQYQQDNIGRFNAVEEYLNVSDFFGAVNSLNQINTSFDWEYNLKRVYEIITQIENNSNDLDSVMITELENMAWQNSTIGGPGVISARALLSLDIEDFGNGTTRSSEFIDENVYVIDKTRSAFEIYPNPVNDKVQIEISVEQDFEYEIEILDFSGKRIYQCLSLSNKLIIDVSSYSDGIYYVVFRRDQIVIEARKLSIVK